MRRRKPCREPLRIRLLDLLIGLKLPRPVIDVIELGENMSRHVTSFRDRGAGDSTAFQGTGVDRAWPPDDGNTLGDRLSLGPPAAGKRQVLSTAKPLRFDSFHMAMAGQEDLCTGGGVLAQQDTSRD